MAEPHSVTRAVSGAPDKTLTFETGKLAGQAGGAVTVRLGDTVVLVTATAAGSARDGADFFPLTVDIEERMYAAGKIPGSFFRREGKASDQAILTCRLIDRPLRPCFPDGFRNEVHVVGTILGADLVNPHDVVAINGASAALSLSGIPFDGPIGAVRVAFTTDGEWIPFPTYEEGAESTFELVVAGRLLDNDDVAISMVEAGGTEASWAAFEGGAPKVTEEVIAEGLEAAKTWIRDSIKDQLELIELAGGRKPTMAYSVQADYTPEVLDAVNEVGSDRILASQEIADKDERGVAEGEARAAIVAELLPRFEGTARRREADQGGVPVGHQGDRAQAHRQRGQAHRRSRRGRHPAAVLRGRGPPQRARLRPVPAGRDPGAQRHHPRHAPHGADARHPRHPRPQALHAPLQLPAVLHRRDRLHARPEAPRDRPRHARRAGPRAGAAHQGRVRLHASAPSPTCCRPTAPPRWVRSAARPCR